MSEPTLQELSATVAALRTELDAVQAQLKDIGRAVQITEENGRRRIRLKCHSLAVRTTSGEQPFAMRLGSSNNRGYLSFYYPDGSKGDIALSLGFNEDDHPAIRLTGQDDQHRVLLTVENDHGLAGCFAPGYTPGAVMRSLPGGGSFAVLQPDGKARGIFMHGDSTSPDKMPATKLLFATPDATTMLSLHADLDGSMIALSQPGAPNCASLVAYGDSSSLVVRSPGAATAAVVIASPGQARVMTCTGREGSGTGEAALTSCSKGGCLSLHRPDATSGLEARAAEAITWFGLFDREGLETIGLCEGSGLHAFNIYLPGSKTKSITFGSTADTAYTRISCPGNEQLQLVTNASPTTVITTIMDGERPLVAITHCETGGSIAAYGAHETPGYAALSGQLASASLTVSMADGTTLAGLGATDHGGHLTLNNDLGFPRITMGIFQESSAISLNHTGQKGMELLACPLGGVLLVHDKDGQVTESLTGFDDDTT